MIVYILYILYLHTKSKTIENVFKNASIKYTEFAQFVFLQNIGVSGEVSGVLHLELTKNGLLANENINILRSHTNILLVFPNIASILPKVGNHLGAFVIISTLRSLDVVQLRDSYFLRSDILWFLFSNIVCNV